MVRRRKINLKNLPFKKIYPILVYMNINMQSPEIQKLRKENPAEYRRKYDNHRLYNKEWYCDICNNGKNYTLRGKWSHLGTKKHERNHFAANSLIKL